MTTRKKYSKEFKLDAVNLVTDQAAAAFNFKKWMREVIFWPHYLELILPALVRQTSLRYA